MKKTTNRLHSDVEETGAPSLLLVATASQERGHPPHTSPAHNTSSPPWPIRSGGRRPQIHSRGRPAASLFKRRRRPSPLRAPPARGETGDDENPKIQIWPPRSAPPSKTTGQETRLPTLNYSGVSPPPSSASKAAGEARAPGSARYGGKHCCLL
jgi:hypothetical protein